MSTAHAEARLCAAGDYWPGEAENALAAIAESNRQAGKAAKKGGGARKGKGKRCVSPLLGSVPGNS